MKNTNVYDNIGRFTTLPPLTTSKNKKKILSMKLVETQIIYLSFFIETLVIK